MATKKISELTAATAPDGSELLEGVQSGTNKKLTLTQVKTFVGATEWGSAWAFPAGAFPTATKAGTIYIATADKGVPGDPDYVQAGSWMIASVDGANEFSEFYIK